jgi:hypothetical protein
MGEFNRLERNLYLRGPAAQWICGERPQPSENVPMKAL